MQRRSARLWYEFRGRSVTIAAHQSERVCQSSVGGGVVRIFVDSQLKIFGSLAKTLRVPFVPKISPFQIEVVRFVRGCRSGNRRAPGHCFSPIAKNRLNLVADFSSDLALER